MSRPDYLEAATIVIRNRRAKPGNQRLPVVTRVEDFAFGIAYHVTHPLIVGEDGKRRLPVRKEPSLPIRHQQKDRQAYRRADIRDVLRLNPFA